MRRLLDRIFGWTDRHFEVLIVLVASLMCLCVIGRTARGQDLPAAAPFVECGRYGIFVIRATECPPTCGSFVNISVLPQLWQWNIVKPCLDSPSSECEAWDRDGDGDVDLADLQSILGALQFRVAKVGG